jgi:hypothetical protein
MALPEKYNSDLKKIEPGDNLKRLMLSGAFPDGWIHGRISFKIDSIDRGSVFLIMRIHSIYDGSLVKEIKLAPGTASDMIEISNVIASYQIDVVHFDGNKGG